MKNLKKVLCFVLVCVLIGSLLPMTAAAEDIKITSMEFSVENLKVGEKGTALKAHVAGDQPITLNHLASLRYDDAGEPGLLVKSNLLERGEVYWLCINPVVKSGYSLTPYILLQKESWTINGLPKGVAIDKVIQSGSQVRFRLTPMVEEIDTVNITGLRAPQLGQTVEEYYIALDEDMVNGTYKVNGFTMDGDWRFGNMIWDYGWLCDETKAEITDVSKQIAGGTYYLTDIFVPTNGFAFADDVTVTVADAAGVETKLDGDYLLVYTKHEVVAPVFTEQPVGGTVAPGETKTVKWATNFTPVKNVLLKVKTHPVDGMKITSENLGTATTAEVGAGYEYYIIRSYYSDSGYVNSEKFYVNELETYTVTFDSDGGSAVAAQTVEDGKTATKPADPTKEGYTFKGWYLGSTAYDFSKPVTGNITLTAKWEKVVAPTTYTITFDPNGGSVTPTTKQTDTDGWLTGLPIPTHSDPNKLFDGWHTSKTAYSKIADTCKFSKDTTLYAHWKDKPAHTIAEVYIDSVQIPAAGVMPSNHVSITTAGVHGITDSGDTFWVRYDAATNNLTDTYEDDTHVDSVPFRAGETYLLMLAMEAQPSYGFTPDVKVFYKGKELPAPSMSDITASAILDHDDEYICVIINPGKAENTTYTVTFDSDGGSAVAKQTVEEGKAAAKPADPTRSGYTFQGWYLGETKYDFSKPVTGNITLKAKWEKKQPAHTHTYTDGVDGTCNGCGAHREEVETRVVVHMFRMYNPNTGEHFYTGSTEERDNLIAVGWQYEGVGFTFPANTGLPVHRLFQPSTGEHLYTMSEAEKDKLMAEGWNYEGIAFNSAYETEAVQHILHNPNATVGAYHFTFSQEEMNNLIAAGWEYQGIGWYSCWK